MLPRVDLSARLGDYCVKTGDKTRQHVFAFQQRSSHVDKMTTYSAMPIRKGVYAPIPTAFKSNEDVDIDATVRHALRLAAAGVGLVIAGSTGEAIALTSAERSSIINHIREALSKHGDEVVKKTPIIAGTGSGSLRETIALSKEAAQAGADAVLIIAPGYFSMAIAQNRKALKEFFTKCADESPVPVMIYNFPAAAGGIDLDSELLEEIAEHPNICGAKLTCAGVGKAGRLANSGNVKGKDFHVFPGQADIMFSCAMIGSTGTIAGTANVVPRLCVEHFDDICAFQQTPSQSLLAKIKADQDLLSRADRAISKGGIVATKYALERFYYPQGLPRKPLQATEHTYGVVLEKALQPALERGRELERKAGVKNDVMKV